MSEFQEQAYWTVVPMPTADSILDAHAAARESGGVELKVMPAQTDEDREAVRIALLCNREFHTPAYDSAVWTVWREKVDEHLEKPAATAVEVTIQPGRMPVNECRKMFFAEFIKRQQFRD
jgi:hypothetical protein